jgi:ubiquitin fusion degradation protein 1
MTFEVSTQSGKRSFCGVLEFTAPEGQICIPRWMQQNLQIKEGTVVQVRRVALPKVRPYSSSRHTLFLLPAT